MKYLAPLAGILLISSGCSLDRPKPVAEEVRHPSNEMNTPAKPVEPEYRKPKRVAVKSAAKKPVEPVYEDPRKIPVGIEYKEMVRRFGLPTMRVTDDPSWVIYSYSKLKTQVQVDVWNGKVTSVAAINTGY